MGILVLIPSLGVIAVGDFESGDPVFLFTVPTALRQNTSDKSGRAHINLQPLVHCLNNKK